MPRWYDIPVVWLRLQVLVMAAFLAVVRWSIPDLSGALSTIVYVAGSLSSLSPRIDSDARWSHATRGSRADRAAGAGSPPPPPQPAQ